MQSKKPLHRFLEGFATVQSRQRLGQTAARLRCTSQRAADSSRELKRIQRLRQETVRTQAEALRVRECIAPCCRNEYRRKTCRRLLSQIHEQRAAVHVG